MCCNGKHDLKIVTADFAKKDGYLRFVYNQEELDENNKIVMTSGGILVRTSLQKTDSGWVVIDMNEHP